LINHEGHKGHKEKAGSRLANAFTHVLCGLPAHCGKKLPLHLRLRAFA
jgi:hypothetical protein